MNFTANGESRIFLRVGAPRDILSASLTCWEDVGTGLFFSGVHASSAYNYARTKEWQKAAKNAAAVPFFPVAGICLGACQLIAGAVSTPKALFLLAKGERFDPVDRRWKTRQQRASASSTYSGRPCKLVGRAIVVDRYGLGLITAYHPNGWLQGGSSTPGEHSVQFMSTSSSGPRKIIRRLVLRRACKAGRIFASSRRTVGDEAWHFPSGAEQLESISSSERGVVGVSIIWQVETDSGFRAYDDAIAAKLEKSFHSILQLQKQKKKKNAVTFSVGNYKYSVDLSDKGNHVQTNISTKKKRRVIRSVLQSSSPMQPGESATCCPESFSTPARKLRNGVEMYSLDVASVATSPQRTRDADEFFKALGAFCSLTGVQSQRVSKIDVYVNPVLLNQYHNKLRSLHNAKEVWVLHGTKQDVVEKIMVDGFLVGGVGGHPAAHGSVHGTGVYTATTNAALSYGGGSGGGRLILCLALEGKSAKVKAPNLDCWKPVDGWTVFKDGSYLLPMYVIHYT